MVLIVTGRIDTGKTGRLLSLHRKSGGTGFLSVKTVRNGVLHGYDLVQIDDMSKRVPFARYRDLVADDWNEAFHYGPFSFSRSGLEFGISIVEHAIDNGISPIFIDEIGPVELEGMGFSSIFRRVLNAGMDVVVACRENLVDDVIEHFKIRDWRLDRPF